MICLCGKEVTGEEFYKHIWHPNHASSPAQWTEAYKLIEAGRERVKTAAKKDSK